MTDKTYRWKNGFFDSEIEMMFTKYMVDHYDEMFHEVVAFCKGPEKVCLLRDKPKD